MERIKLMTWLINKGLGLIQAKIKPSIFVNNFENMTGTRRGILGSDCPTKYAQSFVREIERNSRESYKRAERAAKRSELERWRLRAIDKLGPNRRRLSLLELLSEPKSLNNGTDLVKIRLEEPDPCLVGGGGDGPGQGAGVLAPDLRGHGLVPPQPRGRPPLCQAQSQGPGLTQIRLQAAVELTQAIFSEIKILWTFNRKKLFSWLWKCVP